jgi:hypothetical protein
MNGNTNPYAAPQGVGGFSSMGEPLPQDVVDFGAIVRRWERMRPWYNAVLVAITLLIVVARFPWRLADPIFWIVIGILAVAANACYFAGPLAEGYGRFLRLWNDAFTPLLFLAGTAFAALLAFGAMVTM